MSDHRYPWQVTLTYTDKQTINIDYETHAQALWYATLATRPDNQTTDPKRATIRRTHAPHQ